MASQPKLTPQEYLAIERKAEIKSEYFAGEMFAMAGASRRHNMIAANVIRALGNQLLDRPCNVYPGDLRVKIPRTGKYTYPDAVVACEPEQFEDEYNDTLLNPAVIIEVLSDTTEAYDRGKKFEHYQRIESLREYILISQYQCRVEQYIRQNDNSWTYREFHERDDVVSIDPINCSLALDDIYAKVDTETEDA
jgi:Uma2 family endonuclease